MPEITNLLSSAEVITLVVAFAVTFSVTEIAKQAVRAWTPVKSSNILPRAIAFVVGYCVTLASWPDNGVLGEQLAALFVAVSNPAIYRIVRWKWPNVADAFRGKFGGKG